MPSFSRAGNFKYVQLPEPTKETGNDTILRLQSLLLKAADAEDHLSELEAEADRYRRDRAVLQERIFHCRAVIAPIRRIPISVLLHIFGFITITSPDAIAQLGMVCRTWREVSVRPHFWSNIIISAEDFSAERKAALFVKRSAHSLLNIEYSQSIPHQSSRLVVRPFELRWRAFDILRSTTKRWRTLYLKFFDCNDASRRFTNLDIAPCLEELGVSILRQCAIPADDGKFGFETVIRGTRRDIFPRKVPLLRSLILETFILPMPSSAIFTQLTKISIRDNYSDLKEIKHDLLPMDAVDVLTFLGCCPNLEDFSFDAEKSYYWWYMHANDPRDDFKSMVELPKLHRLHLHCYFHTGQEIFEHLSAAVLRSVSVKLRPQNEVENPSVTMPTLMFIKRTPQLRYLRIFGLNDCFLAAGLMEHLEELYLEYCPDLDDILERLADWRSWFAPRLSRLTIETDLFKVPDEKIATIVKRRYVASRGPGGPNAIQMLKVNSQDMLEGVGQGDVAKFKNRQ